MTRILPTAIAALITGCIPSVETEVGRYRDVLDPEKTAASTDPISPGDPLDLPTAMRLAVRLNERLSIAGEDYLQTLIDKDRQYAGFLPSISFGVRHFRQQEFSLGNGSSSSGGLSSFAPFESTDLPFTFSMNVFNGFRDYNNVRRAFSAVENREALLKNLSADVQLETAQVYYQVLRSEAAARVLEENRLLQETRLRDIRARFREGVARPLDVAQAEADLADVRVAQVVAQREIRNARNVLAFLAGISSVEGTLSDGVIVPDEIPTDDTSVERSMELREDIRAAVARLGEAERNVLVAWGGFLPVASFDLNLYALKRTFPRDIAWDLLLRAAQPLFAKGLIEADIRAAYSRQRQAQFSLEALKRQVRQEVLNAASDLRASQQRLAELDSALRAAVESFRQASERYKEGFSTNLDVQTALNHRLSAELRLETERLDRKALYLRLLRVIGDFPREP